MSEKLPDEISNKIFLIRGHRVMLDADLANLYGVTTGNLNKAVRRNQFRFQEDFMFQLTEIEEENLIFQIGISSYAGKNMAAEGITRANKFEKKYFLTNALF